VSAAVLSAEMALYHASQGRTLFDQLGVLWKKHGYFQEALVSKSFPGEAGLGKMKALMEGLRKNPPEFFAGQKVALIRDYADGTTWHVKEKIRKIDIDLPSSNVLQFVLSDESMVTARPSGTEPKIKFYASCRSKPGGGLDQAVAEVKARIKAIAEALGNLCS